jgi:hypothetical protein
MSIRIDRHRRPRPAHTIPSFGANEQELGVSWPINPHITGMEHFDFGAPADVFISIARWGKTRSMTFRRFQRGAEAIRHAVERQGAEKLAGTIIEVDDDRFGAAEIRRLYHSDDYPLPRRQSD